MQKGADHQIWSAPSISRKYSNATAHKSDSHVSGGAYQDARKVSLVWNAKLKHCYPPEFRGRMHQTRPSALFSPIFSRAREKIGPPEARQKRPRRNESLQARLLILCARFFLSKPQTEFAVWVFLCKFATTSQSRLRRASIPTPFVPSGHFPLIGGIGPWEGSQGLCAPSKPSPMRGRWHGEAVTDEVEALASM